MHPRPDLFRVGFLTVLVVPPPIAFAFGVLDVRPELRPVAPVVQLISLVVALICYIMYRRTFAAVTATTLEKRGFFGKRTSVPFDSIASVTLVRTYNSGSIDTVMHLLVRDNDHKIALRLRGAFWSEESILAIADALQREPIVPAEPFSQREFFSRFEGSAYWWENKTAAIIPIVAFGFVAFIAGVIGLIQLFEVISVPR